MRQFPRRKLCEMVTQYGESLYDDPLRCEGLLSDLCGQYKREVFILVCALKQKVPVDLLSFSGKVPIELIIVQLANRLQNDLSINKCAARWGVESWALALGLISAAELKKQTIKKMVLLPKNSHNSPNNDLYRARNVQITSVIKGDPDNVEDRLNLTTARKDKEIFFRRVGFMVLMMCFGLVMGWVLCRMG